MSILERLASSLGRADEQPNVELAAELAARADKAAISELAKALTAGPKPIRHDAIKALYEIGALRPDLIVAHAGAFLELAKGKDNRLIWGALSALDAVAVAAPDVVAANLPAILDAADRSSVIAKDKAVSMLARLAAQPKPSRVAWDRLIAILRTAADNQTPMYAEMALSSAEANDPAELAEVVKFRLSSMDQPAKKARLEKVLRRLEKLAKA